MICIKNHVKKDDKVRVIAGKDKGKVGKVLRIYGKSGRVVVENVNLIKKHVKPSVKNKQGGVIEIEAPIHFSNIMLMCDKCMKMTRSGIKVLDDGHKVRLCKKCDEIF